MKKLILLVVVVIIVAIGALLSVRLISGEDTWICQGGQWIKHGEPSKPRPVGVCGEIRDFSGAISAIDYSKGEIIIKDAGRETKLLLIQDSKLSDSDGSVVALSDIYKTFEISGKGSVSAENVLNVQELKIDKSPNIILMMPKDNIEIGLPVEISGVARVFENALNVRIKDKEGNILAERNTMSNSPDMGKFEEFKVVINYAEPKTEEGYVEAFNYSAKDGSLENLDSVSVKFETIESQIIKVFYSNTKTDPSAKYCNKTYAVERRVAKTDGPARIALEEMLVGPTNMEIKNGYFSSIAQWPKIEIQKLTIENGLAKVDFNEALNQQGGGSCKVSAIRSQIENTLKQFSTVKKVEISVDGNVGEALQP